MAVDIVLMGPSCEKAPFDKETWGLPWHEGYWCRYDRLFEIHQLKRLKQVKGERWKAYEERLLNVEVPLYMQEQYYPHVTRFPVEISDYYNSSAAYMIALAIHEGHEEIGIYGLDLTQGHEFQRHNIEYHVGFARGKGIKVTYPKECTICKFDSFDDPGQIERYGWYE